MKSIKYLFLALIAALVLTAFAPVAVPSKPGLISPISKAVKVDPAAVALRWARSAPTALQSISDYDVEVSDSSSVNSDGSFSGTPVDTGNVLAPLPATSAYEYLIPGAAALEYGKTYYWHVRANDTLPSTSAWSLTGVFRMAVEPPTIIAFVPATDLLTLRPTFKWTPGAQNADSYTLQISGDSGFSTLYRTATILPTAIPSNQYIPTTDLTANTNFYWRIRANNAVFGTSAWATSAIFHTANPPTVPVLVSPSSVQTSVTPTLTWKQVSIQSATFGMYEIEIFDTKTDVNNATPVFVANKTVNNAIAPAASLGVQSTISYKITPLVTTLLPATTYYWRVKAYNGDDEYSTSGLYTFYTTIIGQISAATMDPSEVSGNVPGLEDPADPTTKTISGFDQTKVHENANLLSLHPTFKWDLGLLNVQTFTLQVASSVSGSCKPGAPEDSTFASTIISVNLPYTQSEYVANLDLYPNYVLCWRIRGNHSLYGSSDWSDVQMFRTANPPGIPVPISPADKTLTNDNSPKLKWNQVTLPSGTTFGKYEVEISYSSTFTGYTIDPMRWIPPYTDPITYPLPYPILPGDVVLSPAYAEVPPVAAFPLYPIIDQAHSITTNPATTELANSIDEPFYDIAPEPDIVAPFGNPMYGAHTYYWRVRSYNSDGEYSAWSTSRSVGITVDRPTNLHITDCEGNTLTAVAPALVTALTPRPCFAWDNVFGARRGYSIQISTKPTFPLGSVVIVANAGTSTYPGISEYQPPRDLPKGNTLYWRVASLNAVTYGTSLPTVADPFIGANPPLEPKLLAPMTNKLEPTTTPTFIWAPSVIPGGTTFDHYEIQVAQDSKFTYLIALTQPTTADEYDTSYTIASGLLNPAKIYYWRVRACNADPVPDTQCSSWSLGTYFRTSVAVPAPTAGSPDAITNPLRPIFSWDAANAATSYSTFMTRKTTCVTPITGATLSATNRVYQPPTLLPATTYLWCVRTNNVTFGPSAWYSETYLTP